MKPKFDLAKILAAAAFICGIALQIFAYDRIMLVGLNGVSQMIENDPATDRRTLRLRVNEQIAGHVVAYSVLSGVSLLTVITSFAVVLLRRKEPNQALLPTSTVVMPAADAPVTPTAAAADL